MMNKTAKEMFESIGYIPFFTTDRIIAYQSIPNIENEEDIIFVFFYLKTKRIKTCYNIQIDDVMVDIPLLKAIDQQVRELGWVDE